MIWYIIGACGLLVFLLVLSLRKLRVTTQNRYHSLAVTLVGTLVGVLLALQVVAYQRQLEVDRRLQGILEAMQTSTQTTLEDVRHQIGVEEQRIQEPSGAVVHPPDSFGLTPMYVAHAYPALMADGEVFARLSPVFKQRLPVLLSAASGLDRVLQPAADPHFNLMMLKVAELELGAQLQLVELELRYLHGEITVGAYEGEMEAVFKSEDEGILAVGEEYKSSKGLAGG
jgi:hypothetical protein